ncbi:MAG: hypothetical protein U0289_18090 [Cyclobacteriaceae bacterium]
MLTKTLTLLGGMLLIFVTTAQGQKVKPKTLKRRSKAIRWNP